MTIYLFCLAYERKIEAIVISQKIWHNLKTLRLM